ncbi:hypothetical protein ACWEU6_12825 [Streptosporangium sandarakinum]
MSAKNLPVPLENELYAMIAATLPGADRDRVRAVLAAHGVTLSSPLPARRQLCVHRLYCDGTKTGTTDNDGPFTLDVGLGPGPWAIASDINSAGKSSLLWALSWALRGESVEEYRRPDTVEWFSYIRADIEVAGIATSVRLTFQTPDRPAMSLLTADTIDQLLVLPGRQEEGSGVRVAATASPGEVKALLNRFMLDRLGLRPVSVWAAEAGAPKDADGHCDSNEQVHAWASFYYAVALNAGRDKVLLGPTPIGQLPAKLLQIFLDVPYASELTRLSAALKKESQEGRHVLRRATEDAQARKAQIEPLRHALAAAKARLADLEASQVDLSGLLAAVDVAARQVAADAAACRGAEEQLARARKDRLKDERAALRARRSAAARLLLGALDPETCPRCDHRIDERRRQVEAAEHRCAVCTRPLPGLVEDPEVQAAALQRLDERLASSRTAEEHATAALAAAEAALEMSRAAHEQAQTGLAAARASDWFTGMRAAQREVDQLEGALAVATGSFAALPAAVGASVSVTRPRATEDFWNASDTEILNAAIRVLQKIVGERSRALFADLDDKIVEIARRLGVANLTSVNLTLNAHVNAKKSGVALRFSDFSPGERLRMRIATVIGMIMVGREHGIMSHPGLLLIDAPTAEEVVPGDARAVLRTLYEAATTIPGLQIVITSIEKVLWEIFPDDRIVTGPGRRELF